MGADLYLDSLHEPTHRRYEPLFYRWAKKRDNAKSDQAREAAQQQVSRYFELMHSRGYFRDSYND
ncbi:MAG: hypothetical protein WKG00_42095, partial [Polyangiaceae bacterium]